MSLAEAFEDMTADGTAWGQFSRGGRWHAFTPSVWREDQWDQACNQRGTYTDLRLFSLDVEPEPEWLCRQHACQQAWRITKRSVLRRYGGDATSHDVSSRGGGASSELLGPAPSDTTEAAEGDR